MLVFNCSARALSLFARHPDAELARIVALDYEDVSLDAEKLTTPKAHRNWAIELLQWQLDVSQDVDHPYLICTEVESKFSLVFELEQITGAGGFVELFFSTWLATQARYNELYVNQPDDDSVEEARQTILGFKETYHWYLRELESGIQLTERFAKVYNKNAGPVSQHLKTLSEPVEKTVLSVCQDWLNVTEQPCGSGEVIAPAESLDMQLLMLADDM